MRMVLMTALVGHTYKGIDRMKGDEYEVDLGDVETLQRLGASKTAHVKRERKAPSPPQGPGIDWFNPKKGRK